MSADQGLTSAGAEDAAGLHQRIREATASAREATGQAEPTFKRRMATSAIWALLNQPHFSATSSDGTVSPEHAVRIIVRSLLGEAVKSQPAVSMPLLEGRLLIVRSGPWPVLRALLERIRTQEPLPLITVLCHRRDEDALREAAACGPELAPLCYPRFEAFNGVTLERILRAQPKWRTAIALDGARTGTGRALEHVTTAMSSCADVRFVWNAAGELHRVEPLRQALGRERYGLLRGLLRWHASRHQAPR